MTGNVFANGLEISGKAVQAQTIAAMPDVCFTPPENPATPPGVPIPYPSFGMASDTESGTATVLISGEIVNIKNKSDEKKTSGTEAGCAAKKGVITSKNTGKKYFNSWSTDVKFEGEPVIRFSDLATHNHASPVGNAPPWPELANMIPGGIDCSKVLAGLNLHKHSDKKKACDCAATGKESEHMLGNALLQNERGSKAHSIPGFGGYSANTAPSLCMDGPSSDSTTEHGKKTRKQEAFKESLAIKNKKGEVTGYRRPTAKEAIDAELKSVRADHKQIAAMPKKKQDEVMECLEAVIYDHLEKCSDPKKTKDEIKKTELRVPGEGDVVAPITKKSKVGK
jgi:hypothetical protein